MTTPEAQIVCTNCGETFPGNLDTIVRSRYETPDGKSEERVFHSPECAREWEQSGSEMG